MGDEPTAQNQDQEPDPDSNVTSFKKQTETSQETNGANCHYLKTFPSLAAFFEDVARIAVLPSLRHLRDITDEYASLITAVATAVIAVFTIRLWVASNEQWITARDQLEIGMRPYVEIAKSPQGEIAKWITDKHGTKTGVDLYFENIGNTPAQRLYVNGGTDPLKFVHLSMKPEPVQMTAPGGFEVRPGESIMMDVVNGTRRWIPGISIPAHDKLSIQVNGFGVDQIAKGFKNGNFQVAGDFEYVDTFGEYCCEPFNLVWDGTHFSNEPIFGPRNLYCAPNIPNICGVRGEPTFPEQLLKTQ